MVCLACGHQLDGFDGRKCPNCGRPFNPNRPASVQRQKARLGPVFWAALAASAGAAAILLRLWLKLVGEESALGGALEAVRKAPVKILASLTNSEALAFRHGQTLQAKPAAVNSFWICLTVLLVLLVLQRWASWRKSTTLPGASSDLP